MGYWSCEGGLGVNGLARRVLTIRKIQGARTSDAGRGCKLNGKASQTSSQATRESINQASRQARMDHKRKQSRKKRERETDKLRSRSGVSIQTASSHLSVICLVVSFVRCLLFSDPFGSILWCVR